jgi:hypothetical protein
MRLSSFVIPILSASTAFALSKLPRPYRRTFVHDTCGSLNSDLILNEVIDSHGTLVSLRSETREPTVI